MAIQRNSKQCTLSLITHKKFTFFRVEILHMLHCFCRTHFTYFRAPNGFLSCTPPQHSLAASCLDRILYWFTNWNTENLDLQSSLAYNIHVQSSELLVPSKNPILSSPFMFSQSIFIVGWCCWWCMTFSLAFSFSLFPSLYANFTLDLNFSSPYSGHNHLK